MPSSIKNEHVFIRGEQITDNNEQFKMGLNEQITDNNEQFKMV